MQKLSNDEFLLIIEQTSFKDLLNLCSTSKEIQKKCIENKDYIVKIYLKKFYSSKQIQTMININSKYNIYQLNKVVQNYFDDKKINDILDNTLYVLKSGQVFVLYKGYILPLPNLYYIQKMDTQLYIEKINDYIKFKGVFKDIIQNLLNNFTEYTKIREFDFINIENNGIEYKKLKDEIQHFEEIIDGGYIKKESDLYKHFDTKIVHLKNLYNLSEYKFM